MDDLPLPLVLVAADGTLGHNSFLPHTSFYPFTTLQEFMAAIIECPRCGKWFDPKTDDPECPPLTRIPSMLDPMDAVRVNRQGPW